jgi:hypothetical protein
MYSWGVGDSIGKIPGTEQSYRSPVPIDTAALGSMATKTIVRITGSYPIALALTSTGVLYAYAVNPKIRVTFSLLKRVFLRQMGRERVRKCSYHSDPSPSFEHNQFCPL